MDTQLTGPGDAGRYPTRYRKAVAPPMSVVEAPGVRNSLQFVSWLAPKVRLNDRHPPGGTPEVLVFGIVVGR
ncbi:hypothetical protein [Neorhodopirellula lusitana]|uniref:hypothetical protein n=1 Tax=Neorhodopirellula lusitana TaxID=445327 RepID=UPI00384FABE5